MPLFVASGNADHAGLGDQDNRLPREVAVFETNLSTPFSMDQLVFVVLAASLRMPARDRKGLGRGEYAARRRKGREARASYPAACLGRINSQFGFFLASTPPQASC